MARPDFQNIAAMRQRLGLSADDTSSDDAINAMSPMERLRLIAGWYLGDQDWAYSFVAWAKDAGFEISVPAASNVEAA